VTSPRLYWPRNLQEDGIYALDAGRRHYLSNVLRLRPGDAVTLFDGSGWDFHAVIERMGDREAAVRITGRKEIAGAAPSVRITLAQALPKGAKMDGIVEKATEIGAVRIVPFHSARSVPRLDAAKAAARLERWEKIAVEAARRCRRPDVPAIERIASFGRMLALAEGAGAKPAPGRPGGGNRRRNHEEASARPTAAGEFFPAPLMEKGQRQQCRDLAASPSSPPPVRIIFWEEGGRDIKSLLRPAAGPPPEDYFVVVGPEGGFAPEEVAAARASGLAVAGLGHRILRVETASLVILTIIQYERGIFAAPDQPEGAGAAETPRKERDRD